MPEKCMKALSELLSNYWAALQSGNADRALLAGIEYYNHFRNGKLLNDDREQIQNDILDMTNKKATG